MIKKLFVLLTLVLCSTYLFGQQTPEERVNKDYSKLYKNFKDKVGEQKAHYIFAIDISSSMKSMEASVKANIKNFIDALPNGDKITLIQMANKAETQVVNLTDYQNIDKTTRLDITSYVGGLKYKNNGAPGDGSDGFTMTELIVEALNKAGSSSDMKYVFIFSDLEFYDKNSKTGSNGYNKNAMPWKSLEGKIKRDETKAMQVFGLIIKKPKNLNAVYKSDLQRIFPNFNEVNCPDNASILNKWFTAKKAEILNDRLKNFLMKETERQNVSLVLKASGLGDSLKISLKDSKMSSVFSTAELDATSLAEVKIVSGKRPWIGSIFSTPSTITVKAKLLAPNYVNTSHPNHTPSNPYNEAERLLEPQFEEYKIEVYEGKPYLAWYLGWPLVAVLGFWILSVLYMLFIKKVTRTWSVRGTIKENNGATIPIKGTTPNNPTSFCIGRSIAQGNFDVNIDGVGFCFKIESRKNISCLPFPGVKSGYYIANIGTGSAELIDAFKKTTALGNNNFKFLSKPGAFTPITLKIKEGNKEFEIKIQ